MHHYLVFLVEPRLELCDVPMQGSEIQGTKILVITMVNQALVYVQHTIGFRII